ncbi:DUF2490 domain-containing protein [Sphingomonas sp. BN140010]|uniref:DUF2490 domain-containing protein n=1 Tax=Sphingomonas arvum TaxID=2992113 RepID=A0ABT3JE43_9SPHN|nr:DUF2490 domain-containing protein [Sphingomonas sp. BN140010]MCW3797279.1 DUF2490 domain-containing protein [Sphingomonas sp. BN140010]
MAHLIRRSALSAILLGGVVLPGAAHARDDSQIWTGASATVNLGGKWRLSQELVGRFSDNRDGLYEIESNTLIGYKLTPKVTIAAGYTHDPQYASGDFTVLERRAREQVSIDNFAKVGPGNLFGRMRFEQRWHRGIDGTGWRVRPYLRYAMPLVGKTSLVLSDEQFVNLNTPSFQAQKGFERMRNLAAINAPLSKSVNAEVGYLNQYFFIRNGPDNVDHVASLMLNFSL